MMCAMRRDSGAYSFDHALHAQQKADARAAASRRESRDQAEILQWDPLCREMAFQRRQKEQERLKELGQHEEEEQQQQDQQQDQQQERTGPSCYENGDKKVP